jgi:hypothetical protein
MKDAKGHGSEARGGSGALSRDDLAKQVAFVKAAGKAATPAQEAWLLHAQDRLNYGRGEPRVGGPGMKGAAMGSVASGYWSAKSLANIGGGQPVASNAHAAATLASGTKSAPVDVHPAQSSSPKADAFYKDLETRQAGQTFPKHGYMPNDPGNRPGNKPTDL